MKLLYCINSTFNSAGMERILMRKTNYLINKGYNIVIVTTEQLGRENFFNFSSKIKFIDLSINYNLNNNLFLPLRFAKLIINRIKHKKLLKQVLMDEKPDISISMFHYDFSFLCDINDGSKKILEFHFSRYSKVYSSNNYFLKSIQYLRTIIWKSIIKKYDRFVVLTEADKHAWGKISNIRVLPNIIDQIPDRRADLYGKTVCSIGRIEHQKGFDLLIKAWSIVHKYYPDWKLRIIGGGDSSSLQKMVEAYTLTESVTFVPPTVNISVEYLKSSLYVLSSRYEPFGLVLIEAMSYGLPIVSFNCPCGPNEIIEKSFGTLVPQENVERLADALMFWMHDGEKREYAGSKARLSAKRYLEDNVMKQWEKLFDSLVMQK